MKGWEIFIHSVRLVFSNLEAALKLSLVPYALSGLAYVFLGSGALSVLESATPEDILATSSEVWSGLMIYFVVALISFLWIAVSWHRYVLLEEYPSGWFPTFHGGPVFTYFGRGALIVLLIVGVILALSLVSAFLLVLFGSLGQLVAGFLPFAVGSYLFYRLCPILPSAAIGRPLSVTQAWQATANQTGTILALIILLMLLSLITQIPNQVGGADSMIGIIYSLVIGWFMTLIGSSVLTTFYGHFIEGRAID